MQFLLRPRPRVNEILSSYLLRLTGANGYFNYRVVSEYVDIQSDLHKFNYLSKSVTSLTLLSATTGVSESRLWEMVFPAIDDRSVKAYGSVLEYDWIEREKIKICPSCIAETGYTQKHWALWLCTNCALHQCLLVDRCPECETEWQWNKLKSEWKCVCGFNFANIPIASIDPADNEHLINAVIHSCGLSEGKINTLLSGSPLHSLSLSQLSLLMMSTALCLHNPSGSLHQLKLPSSNRELHPLLSRAAKVYQSESSNLSYFLRWFKNIYQVEFKRVGQRKNHLQKLSLITDFDRQLDRLHLWKART